MSVTIGPYTFPDVHYDKDGDVLYLHTVSPDQAVDFDESPEGHGLRFDATGALVGITILNAKWLVDNEGKVTVTVPQHLEATAPDLSAALVSATAA